MGDDRDDRFRAMFEGAVVGMVQADAESGAFLEVNPAFCGMLGYAREELLRVRWTDVTHPEDVGKGIAARTLALGPGGRAGPLDKRFLRKDGTSVYARITLSRTADKTRDGGRALFVVVEDRTPQHEAEELSRELDAQKAAIFRMRHVAIAITTLPDGRVVDANDGLVSMTGWPREHLVGRSGAELGILPSALMDAVSRGVATDGVFGPYETEFQTRSGETRVAVFSSTGATVGGRPCAITVAQDVTALREAGRARARSESLAHLQTSALEATDDGILITDGEGQIQWVNASLARMTGYDLEDLVGRPARMLANERQDEFSREILATVRAGGSWRGDYPARRKDGSTYAEFMSVTPVRDREGRVTHTVAVKRDVTAIRRAQDELRAAQKMEAVGQLAGGVAHDFNNLLSVILSYAESVKAELPEEDRLREDVTEIQQAAERATGLTRQLLAFSRRQVLEVERVDLDSLVDGLAKMLRRLIREDVTLTIRSAGGLHAVRADRGQLEQVLMNLVVNARDAMPDGGEVVISTSLAALTPDSARDLGVAPGSYVCLEVADTGTGMNEATRARVFEPFFTTKGVGRGTGLGLATVYGIVKQSGGGIDLETALGQGSRFRVYLPRDATPEGEGRHVERESMPVGGTETVLVVEDEPALRAVVARTLEQGGYRVLTAASAAEAARVLEGRGESVDLLLSDVVMPGGGARELATRWQARFPRCRVLFMSGYSDVTEHGEIPAARLLRKPFDRGALRARVRATLDAPSE